MPELHPSTELTQAFPTPEDLLAFQEEAVKRMDEAKNGELELIVPQTVPERLGATLVNVPPEPLGNTPIAARCWFDLMSVLGEFEGGATAKQVARRIGHENYLRSLVRLLDGLAARGDIRRSTKGAIRYHVKPASKVLPHLLRQFPGRLPLKERETFELAVLTYQDSPGAQEWRSAIAALMALIAAIPGWPAEIISEVKADPIEWLRLIAGIEPPAYQVEEADPLVARLTADLERLRAENAELRSRLQEATDEITDLTTRLELAEADAIDESALWGDSRATLEEFIAGHGRGILPSSLSDGDLSRLRALITATKANRKDMLAIAAGLGEVYRNPTGHQRLTTLSFKDHPFDSLWRARVGHYRIVYGLLQNTPHPVAIATRGEVYEQAVHALRSKRW